MSHDRPRFGTAGSAARDSSDPNHTPSSRPPAFRLPSLVTFVGSRPRSVLPALVIIPFFLGACAYYSFTGATIPSHLETVAIPLADDISTSSLSNLGDELTRLFVARFVGQTRLSLETVDSEADVVLTAEIRRYMNEPAAVGGEAQATLNRITITVFATYFDQVNEEEIFERTFTASDEYDPAVEGLAGEETAAAAALENIADDVFTAATSDW